MNINQVFELSMVLDTDQFQKVLAMAYSKSNQLDEVEEGYVDLSMKPKGITVMYRDSRYKKRVRMFINACIVVDNPHDTDKLVRKLDKRITAYFNRKYQLEDFTLSGVNLFTDIDVGKRKTVSDYLKVMQRVGKVKGFAPVNFDFLDDADSFCLTGNSNDIDFLFYDLEEAIIGQLRNAGEGWKKIETASIQTKGILRAEVRLMKPKAVRAYTDADGVSDQIVALTKNSTDIFMETFTRAVPFGDFFKMDAAAEIVRSEVTGCTMQRKMLRLLSLIPKKKSLHLAQKAMNCRDVEKVMESFAKIHLSPVTIGKRHDVRHLDNIYSYIL